MEYKLLDIGEGIILSRQPQIVEEELVLSFEDAPSDSTAIFETKNGDSFYRVLTDGCCSLPISKMDGEIKVSVARLNGETPLRRWRCEELKVSKLRNGGALVAPNDMNLPQRFVELKLENESIRKTNERMELRISELEEKLVRLLEGYDLT